jgi:maltooligosyltrehalose synthase
LVWDDTAMLLPEVKGVWKDGITGRAFEAGASASIAELFMDLPFAVLTHRA